MNSFRNQNEPSTEDLALQASPTFQMLHRQWTGLAPVGESAGHQSKVASPSAKIGMDNDRAA